ncbi:MAG: histone deacetylase family protein [Aestuariivirga sp.]|uniref:histone deacetylase family protein n=1 Tax=Aestuariivirga sp. TaxID=2650926 RepID=UPI0038D00CF9
MKAVFSAMQLGHAPRYFLSKGHIVDYPESPERARALLEGARQAGAQICATRRFDDEVLHSVHNQRYLEFLKEAHGAWSEIEGAAPELMPSLRPLAPSLYSSPHIMARAGRFLMDFSCAIGPRTWESARASAMTALTAADLCLKGESIVYALCRPPGHHAYANKAGGFCYLNNTALAAQFLRGKHRRVAVLDIDVHHGNGTQAIFYSRPDVLTVSIHATPEQFYPFYWGGADETGEGEGRGFNLNLPLPVGAGDAAWMKALEQAVVAVQDFAPQSLVIALGLDAHEADPLQGGKVTQAGFARMAEAIAALKLPTVIVQEGGYLTEHLPDNLAMFLAAYEGAHTPVWGEMADQSELE